MAGMEENMTMGIVQRMQNRIKTTTDDVLYVRD